jgi:hypothetical protein
MNEVAIDILNRRIAYLNDLDKMINIEKSYTCKARLDEAKRILAILQSTDLTKEPIKHG